MHYPFTTATALAQAIGTKQVSPVEVMRQCLDRQAALELVLNCFVTTTPESAMAAAQRAQPSGDEQCGVGSAAWRAAVS